VPEKDSKLVVDPHHNLKKSQVVQDKKMEEKTRVAQ